MTPEEKRQISELNKTLPDVLRISLIDNDRDDHADLNVFSKDLAALAPRIHLTREKDESQPTPFLRITDSISYRGVPSGTEFEPFMELLAAATDPDWKGRRPPDKRITSIETPAILKLYVSSVCPHCPAMVKTIYPLSLLNGNLKLTIIDGPAFPDLAEADNIMAVPTLILDDNFRWTASIDIDELLRIIVNRNPSELGVASLKSIIQDGNAYHLSAMMLEAETIFPAFIDLLTHAEFSVRLGAMAAIEDVAEKNRSVSAQAVTLLIDRFEAQSAQVKGDMLYVIEVCGDGSAVPFLRSVAEKTEDSEIREAAEDALATLLQS